MANINIKRYNGDIWEIHYPKTTIGQVINLSSQLANMQSDIDGKAPETHTHSIANISGLQTELNSKLTSISNLRESYLIWGGKNLSGQVTPIGMSLSNEHSANRLAFINGNSLYFEYSSNGGSTWTDYGYNVTTKSQFCTTSAGVPIGRTSSATEYTTLSRTRITLTAQNGSTGYVYTNPRKMLINVSSSGGMEVLVETRTGANYQAGGAWTTFGTYNLSGWSGWNDIPLVLGTLGGGTTQTGNNWQLRLTFIMTSKNNNYPTTANVQSIRIYGENAWSTPSTMAATGNLYSFDISQNATFPAKLTATSLVANGTLSLRASALGSTPTHILVASADPSGTTRTVQTRTPAQLLSDIGAMSTSHTANLITSTNIINWNKAYGWGNHASAGYQTAITMGTDTTNTSSPGYAGAFTAIDSITKDSNGHVTKINTKTVTMPSAQTLPTIPSVMDTTEGNTGTATTQRTISAANLKSIILNHSPAGARTPTTHNQAYTTINSVPTGHVLGRNTSGVGSAEAITYANLKGYIGLGNVTNESKATMFTDPAFTGDVTIDTTPGSLTKNSKYLYFKYNRGSLGGGITQKALYVDSDGTLRFDGAELSKAGHTHSWSEITTGKPTFATVATSGSYNDLSNKPSIPAAQVQSNWNATTGMGAILNKPNLATVATSGSYNDLSNKPTIPTIPSVMDTTEGNTGTATTQRTISAKNLKDIILHHSPAGARTPTTHNHNQLYNTAGDTRNIPTLPSHYNNVLKISGYKDSAAVGRNGSLMGVNGYADSSGGVLELSWNNDRFSYRTAKNSSEWNPWGEVASEQWVTANTRSNTWTPTWSQVTGKPSNVIRQSNWDTTNKILTIEVV